MRKNYIDDSIKNKIESKNFRIKVYKLAKELFINYNSRKSDYLSVGLCHVIKNAFFSVLLISNFRNKYEYHNVNFSKDDTLIMSKMNHFLFLEPKKIKKLFPEFYSYKKKYYKNTRYWFSNRYTPGFKKRIEILERLSLGKSRNEI